VAKEFVDAELESAWEGRDRCVFKDAVNEVVLNDAIVLVDVVAGMGWRGNEGRVDVSGSDSSSTGKGGVSII
jgi:hypothetical protein